jgi:hypothetical protein
MIGRRMTIDADLATVTSYWAADLILAPVRQD